MKKKNLLLILGIVLIVAVLIVGIILGVDRKEKPYDSIEEALEKVSDAKSLTVRTSVKMKASGNEINLSLDIKAEEKEDKIEILQIKLNKNMFIDEMSLFARIDEKQVNLYTQSNLIDLMGMTKGKNEWIYYDISLDDLNLKDLEKEAKNNKKIEPEKILDEKHLRYVGEENNLKHYELIIDKELLEKLKDLYDEETYKALKDQMEKIKQTVVDIYLTKNNELSKIGIDMSEAIKDMDSEEVKFDKIVFEMELLDVNKTKIDIPEEALHSETDIEEYIQRNYVMPEGNEIDPGMSVY